MKCWKCHRRGYLFRCRRCEKYFCSRHRLPEYHNCPNLRRGNIFENIAREKQSNEKEESYEERTKPPIKRKKTLIAIIILAVLIALSYFIFQSGIIQELCKVCEPKWEQGFISREKETTEKDCVTKCLEGYNTTTYNFTLKQKFNYCYCDLNNCSPGENAWNKLESSESNSCFFIKTTKNSISQLFDNTKKSIKEVFEGELNCSDGTYYNHCSKEKPYYCSNGTLVKNSSNCGCPYDYRAKGNDCELIPRCSDRTVYDECSNEKPLFCLNGNLIKKASKCGCGWGYSLYNDDCLDSNKVESIEATDYLNEIRNQNGRNPVSWDENLYELALFRTKDMYDRQYFDHVTPDGECVKDFKANYGLAEYNIAENAGASLYGQVGDKVDYADYANVKEQIDGWMNSRGHRYNLLYPSHILGVAMCYKGACVFLGANQEYYGLGYGPCTTGDEGMAYWNSAEEQPGEI